MQYRLALFGFSAALFLGHLFRYFPGLRQGVSLLISIVLIIVAIGCAAGVIAMFMGKRYLVRVDVIMGILPGLLVGAAILGLIVIGGLI